jgi:hypothetical protein
VLTGNANLRNKCTDFVSGAWMRNVPSLHKCIIKLVDNKLPKLSYCLYTYCSLTFKVWSDVISNTKSFFSHECWYSFCT